MVEAPGVAPGSCGGTLALSRNRSLPAPVRRATLALQRCRPVGAVIAGAPRRQLIDTPNQQSACRLTCYGMPVSAQYARGAGSAEEPTVSRHSHKAVVGCQAELHRRYAPVSATTNTDILPRRTICVNACALTRETEDTKTAPRKGAVCSQLIAE